MAESSPDERTAASPPPEPEPEPGPVSADEAVRDRLDLLHARTIDLVGVRSDGDTNPTDQLRGLYLTSEAALRHGGRALDDVTIGTDDPYLTALAPSGAEDDRIDDLAWRLELTVVDVHVLLAALAPEIDRRFEPLFGYLNDDVTRRRATVALAADLVGLDPGDPEVRARFHVRAPLRAAGLVVLEEGDRPLPSRALRVPDRVVAHLLGNDDLDEELVGHATWVPPADAPRSGPPDAFATRLVRLVTAHSVTLHLRDTQVGRGMSAAVRALTDAGLPVLRHELPADPHEAAALAPAVLREARLDGAVVVAGPLPERPRSLVGVLEGTGVPVVLVDSRPFDPRWSAAGTVLPVDPPPAPWAGVGAWADELGADGEGLDLPTAVGAFRFDPDQIRRAVTAARLLADGDDVPVGVEQLRLGARRQGAARLDQHARRVEPAVGWSDLVLPEAPRTQLQELLLRARYRDQVLGDWRLRPGGARGRGVSALFAGESGTGKTLAAEVVAGELGVVLYVVDLSSVVDKYIGETEKNLDRLFTEADQCDAVLLFDEADAIFGKRSEVKDAHDRHANMESAFLLQRLEAFDGIAVLTTNLRANIDDAFTRRFDLIVDFPFPDAELRTRLWHESLRHAPRALDFDAAALGAQYELSGGAIRSAALTAAYLAAHDGRAVDTQDAVYGARREYNKMGRVIW